MIGRLFWLTLGAVAGVTGYRRLSRLLRAARPAPRRGRPGGLAAFARDVREGMAQYEDQRAAPGRGYPGTDDAKDGR